MRYFIILFFMFLLVSCGTPSKKEVRKKFLSENSTYTVNSVNVSEGDSENIYFHILYRIPNDEKIYEDVWLYQDIGWINTKRKKNGSTWNSTK